MNMKKVKRLFNETECTIQIKKEIFVNRLKQFFVNMTQMKEAPTIFL